MIDKETVIPEVSDFGSIIDNESYIQTPSLKVPLKGYYIITAIVDANTGKKE